MLPSLTGSRPGTGQVPGPARLSAKASTFTESVIRDMTRLAVAHGAVNLAQGFPDFSCPAELKDAAKAAIDADVNQYAITWGAPAFRTAIAAKVAGAYPGWTVDPDTEICVTCGATEAMIATMLGLVDPGEEVIFFEPFYENYGPDAILSGATPRLVKLRAPDWSFDEAELRAAFTDRTRAIVINTPHNPTGKMFGRAELDLIAELCQRYDALVVTDEIYEHIQYLGPGGHIPPATVPGLEDRTVTVNALSKTYAVTGWRVGWTIAPAALTEGIRKTHDFLTVGAAAPLQAAGIAAMGLPAGYYADLAASYQARRDLLCAALAEVGFGVSRPDGAYYVMCDTRALDPAGDDVAFARHLVADIGVACVPGSSFFADPADGRHIIRFAFPKREATLLEAAARLRTLS
ncbi:aminotransferase class I/II-fold pyridoxal phosphate-dependent enzyme [Frankia sp. AgB1.9]|uniref:aminotransferase class I/II-fold pyridoxal phosphate-dependent enzyme n=1 Tax=unclassified Frankia TaxID=2632575 RepID=UPI0019348888|nr:MULTISPECIES: aminotransferase class I/II-fold pyridoxal phosphate-dependent enzyme [unclassified Frankia]MBL7492689.1 aminotransferase class I/II-fold pyridoxal phosphate-dependent enzyme [Frankia sp. AgW1.1]MBL7549695.1 aminotransferase class I/II-fold pyridoxal phosphate-dependent enzyme [Frankia sp. AgB1.9]MBL7623152.1 aminotransferase class I/II-fold pyridoxal phosphate-dependent enzyme [Frankia sp. AgB1.8]